MSTIDSRTPPDHKGPGGVISFCTATTSPSSPNWRANVHSRTCGAGSELLATRGSPRSRELQAAVG
jgi:hypothetical protein